MTNPNPSDTPTKYYFVDDASLIVYVTDNIEDGQGFVYLGTSDNPNYKMAVAAFTQQGKVSTGYRIRELS
jgi:hypothetical protein